MIKFKNVFNPKVISLLIVYFLIFQSMGFAIYETDFTLRLPLKFNKHLSGQEIHLHTDIELAKKGLIALRQLVDSLPIGLVERMTEKEEQSVQFLRVYTGVSPEVGAASGTLLLELDDTSREILIEAIEENDNFIVVKHSQNKYSMVNLEAASRVIREKTNSKYFPEETLSNPVQWIRDNPEEWYDNSSKLSNNPERRKKIDIRYGLLSGFPLNAVKKYALYWKTIRKLNKLDRGFLSYYMSHHKDKLTEADWVWMGKVTQKETEGVLTKEDVSLLLSAHHIDSVLGQFIAFEESDHDWMKKLEKMFFEATLLTNCSLLTERLQSLFYRSNL